MLDYHNIQQEDLMKKLTFLILLTTLFVSLSFALEGIGDFTAAVEISVPNAGSANSEKPLITAEPSLTFAGSFGNFELEAALGTEFSYDLDGDHSDQVYDDIYIVLAPSYTIEAGPGSLSFALAIQAFFPIAKDAYTSFDGVGQEKFWLWADPSIGYDLEAEFGELSFALGTENLTIQDKLNKDGDGYGVLLDLYFQAGIELPVGFGFWAKPRYQLKLHDGQDPAFFHFNLDAHYTINDLVLVGAEFESGEDFEDDLITPYVELSFGALELWAKVEVSGINVSGGDLVVTPIVGLSYTF
jgi:hypothetical protein